MDTVKSMLGFDPLNIYTYPPVHFYLNSQPLSTIPAKFDTNPSIFTLNWWYWHRQELINEDTRTSFWPYPTDLLPAIGIAVLFTLLRIGLNALITPYAVKYMNLSARPLVDTTTINKQLFDKIKQYIDKQQRLAVLTKRRVDPSTLKHNQHQLDQLYSSALQVMSTVQPYASNTKQINETQLKQLINDTTLDSIRAVKIRKFREAGWLFTSYAFLFIFGLCVSLTKPYVWDLRLLWKDWHTHVVSTDTYVYYLLETAHYLHLLFAEFAGVRKKDFIQMTLHHCVTLLLLYFSYSMNFVRIGVLILVIHDASDVFLELAKLCNYTAANNNNLSAKQNATKLQDIFFVIFAVVFMVTRLYIYPFYIYHAMLVRSMEPNAKLGMAPVYWVFAGLLGSLIVLHVIWGSIIIKMVLQFLTGGITGDERSDDEDWTAEKPKERLGGVNLGNKADAAAQQSGAAVAGSRRRSRASSTADEVLNESKRAI